MEKLSVIVLSYCPYCINMLKLLDKLKIKYEKIVVDNNKDEYKNDIISTFPQVYYHFNDSKYLIGGFDKTSSIIEYITDEKDVKKLPLDFDYKVKLRIYTFFVKQLNI